MFALSRSGPSFPKPFLTIKPFFQHSQNKRCVSSLAVIDFATPIIEQANMMHLQVNINCGLINLNGRVVQNIIIRSIKDYLVNAIYLRNRCWGHKGNKEIYEKCMVQLLPNLETLATQSKIKTSEFFELLSNFVIVKELVTIKPEVYTLLAKYVEDINVVDLQGWSFLHWAVLGKHYDAVEILVERGMDPDLKDLLGVSPLDLAIWMLDKKLIQILMPTKDANIILSECSITVLLETTKSLIFIMNQNVNHSQSGGWLQFALPNLEEMSQSNNLSKLELLYLTLYRPVPSDRSLKKKTTPIAYAWQQASIELFKELIDMRWSAKIEELFIKKYCHEFGVNVKGFSLAVWEMRYRENEFYKIAEDLVVESNASGISIEKMECLKSLNIERE